MFAEQISVPFLEPLIDTIAAELSKIEYCPSECIPNGLRRQQSVGLRNVRLSLVKLVRSIGL
jgi:hypothetical protein